MAHYCLITDMTRPHPAAITLEFDLLDDSAIPPTVVMGGASHGFSTVIYDPAGNPIPETVVQMRQRLRAEFDAYAARLILAVEGGDANFDTLRAQAIGYRYPPA